MKKTLLAICAFVGLSVAHPVFAANTSVPSAPEGRSPTTVLARQATGQAAGEKTAPAAASTVTYAEREKATPGVANFKGGDGAGIYIGGSTLAVVLLIVLIVILL